MSRASLHASTHTQHIPLLDIAQSSNNIDGLPDFKYIQHKNGVWTTGAISIQDLCVERERPAKILVVFLPTETALIRVGAHEKLSKRFSIPASFWTSLALEASGFFGSREKRDADGTMKGYSSQFRFLVKKPEEKQPAFPNIGVPYCWHRLGFSTHWIPSHTVVLCFDLTASFKDSLTALIPASSRRLHLDNPFSFHSILMEEVVEFYNTALWSWRDLIRDIEKNRTSEENPQPDYVLMHEMARHAIHSSEMLAMASETLTSITQEHEIFIADSSIAVVFYGQTCKDLRYLSTLFKSLHLRSKALEERLRNEINLAFNVVAQHDSRVAMRIADATQVDSAAMKTIAMLGLVFLPGTFICAIFSTTFFSFSPGSDSEPQSWTMSEKFWVYWVVAIPVTGATVLFWSVWQHWYASRSILKRPAH